MAIARFVDAETRLPVAVNSENVLFVRPSQEKLVGVTEIATHQFLIVAGGGAQIITSVVKVEADFNETVNRLEGLEN